MAAPGKASPIPHLRIDDEEQMQKVYEVGKPLGEGTFGKVCQVTHKHTKSIWACKAVNKEKAGGPAIKLLEREVGILKKVSHDHIIKLVEVFETPKKMYLIMECCDGGELSDALKDKKSFSEDETKTIMKRLASAIKYLHKNNMVHRDLKLENILLSKNPKDSSDDLYIKVTDFGLSVVLGGAGYDNMLMDFCGTPMYMSPEIIDKKTYSTKCDIWSMGVIMFMLIAGCAPFQSKDEDTLYEIIKTADVSKLYTRDSEWKNISKEAKECLGRMLTVDPAHRFTAYEILNHTWITGEGSVNQPNVLELMKEAWIEDQNDGTSIDECARNGEKCDPGNDNPIGESSQEGGATSDTSSRNGSANSAEVTSGNSAESTKQPSQSSKHRTRKSPQKHPTDQPSINHKNRMMPKNGTSLCGTKSGSSTVSPPSSSSKARSPITPSKARSPISSSKPKSLTDGRRTPITNSSAKTNITKPSTISTKTSVRKK